MYKGHMDKAKGGRIEGERWGWLGCGGVVEGKGIQLYLNNNKKRKKFYSFNNIKKEMFLKKWKKEFFRLNENGAGRQLGVSAMKESGQK